MSRELTQAEVAARVELRDTGMKEEEGLLLAPCLRCAENPGSGYRDGSGACVACKGSGWHVLALEIEKPAEEER